MKAMNKSAILFAALTLTLPVGSAFIGNAVLSQLQQSPTVYVAQKAVNLIAVMQGNDDKHVVGTAGVLPLLNEL